jgi:hypothetical protein
VTRETRVERTELRSTYLTRHTLNCHVNCTRFKNASSCHLPGARFEVALLYTIQRVRYEPTRATKSRQTYITPDTPRTSVCAPSASRVVHSLIERERPFHRPFRCLVVVPLTHSLTLGLFPLGHAPRSVSRRGARQSRRSHCPAAPPARRSHRRRWRGRMRSSTAPPRPS